MMRALSLVMIFALATAGRVTAQQDSASRRHDATSQAPGQRDTFRRAVVHYGKWLPVAAAVALTAMGAHEHANSKREFDRLRAVCRANNTDCLIGPDGRYLNPATEQLYQTSVHFDRRARRRLLAGQGALIVAAGLFIADLRRHAGGPENKPLAPLEVSGDVVEGGARVGLRVSF